MELISQFSYPLPITVICDMLGIPPEDREQTRRWSEDLLSAQSPERMEEIGRNIGEFIAYLRDLFARKRTPGDDLISQLLQVEVDGDRLTEDEVLAMVFILFVAGHITTVNLIANGVFALLTNPEQAAKLRSDPGLVTNAVEEILRYYGPAETTTALCPGRCRAGRADDRQRGSTAGRPGRGRPRSRPFRRPAIVRYHPRRRKPAHRLRQGRSRLSRRATGPARGTDCARDALPPLPRSAAGGAENEITWAPSFLRSLTGLPLLF